VNRPKPINLGGWELSWPTGYGEPVFGLVDVIPVNDLRDHVYGGECWCKPVDDEGMWVHNSADGREKLEEGRGVPS
jgi:hypothetical protein